MTPDMTKGMTMHVIQTLAQLNRLFLQDSQNWISLNHEALEALES